MCTQSNSLHLFICNKQPESPKPVKLQASLRFFIHCVHVHATLTFSSQWILLVLKWLIEYLFDMNQLRTNQKLITKTSEVTVASKFTVYVKKKLFRLHIFSLCQAQNAVVSKFQNLHALLCFTQRTFVFCLDVQYCKFACCYCIPHSVKVVTCMLFLFVLVATN